MPASRPTAFAFQLLLFGLFISHLSRVAGKCMQQTCPQQRSRRRGWGAGGAGGACRLCGVPQCDRTKSHETIRYRL